MRFRIVAPVKLGGIILLYCIEWLLCANLLVQCGANKLLHSYVLAMKPVNMHIYMIRKIIK